MRAFIGQPEEWNAVISSMPEPHFLQTWEWAQVKEKYGWKALPFIWQDHSGNVVAAAMILKRQIINKGFAARLSIFYAPKGPLLDWSDQALRTRVLNDLQVLAKSERVIFVKMDPNVVVGRGVPQSGEDVLDDHGQAVRSELIRRGWRYSSGQIQFQNTVLVDLSTTENEMLARMKQKTRYNVRLAEKKDVTVRVGTLDDLPMLYRMYAETSVRDGFVIRDEEYYLTVWRTFMLSAGPSTVPLIAEVDGDPVSAIFLFLFAGRAYYVHGMSRDAHREKMPTYLLQWEAMKIAKARGCSIYDLWGAPDEFDEGDSMWGVYRFKEGLGGEVVRTLGAHDFAPNKLWYKLYADVMPRVLDVMRSRGKKKTGQTLG